MERNDFRGNDVELTLTAVCNVMCVYCPQKILRQAVKRSGGIPTNMSMETFSAILGNIRRPIVTFAGFSEPFQNPRCMDMVEVASQSYPFVVFYSTGAYATDDDLERLAKLPNVRKTWHLDTPNKAGDMPGLKIKATNFIEKIKAMENSHMMVVGKDAGAEDGARKDRIITRAGNTEKQAGKKPELVDYPVRCRMVNRRKRPVVLPDGTAVACCNDYGLELVVGNLARQRYEDLDYSWLIEKMQTPQDIPCFRGCNRAKRRR